MSHLIVASLCFILLVEFKYANGDIGTISGYPQVDIRELNPLTLSWNQVHYLVRENLLEIDELRKMHDDFYKELYECFGLETCLRHSNLLDSGPPADVGGQLGAGALLASLRNERQQLEGRHSNLDMGIRQLANQVNQRQQGNYGSSSSSSIRQGGSQSGRSWSRSRSSSSSSHSYSRNSGSQRFGGDRGPEQGRG